MLKQGGWTGFPSGREKVAMEIALSKADIEKRYGLAFVHGSDSLGPAYSTYFNDEVLGPVSIVCYERSPHGRAIIHVDSKLPLREAVTRLLEVFELEYTLVNMPANLDSD
jgi:hypothetical protein